MLYLRKTFDYDHGLENSQACLVGIPWDSTEIGFPVRYGPLFIREAIKSLPGFDVKTGKNPFLDIRMTDLGDIETVPGSWDLTSKQISDSIRSILDAKPTVIPIALGGEHLITLPIIQELSIRKRKLTVVHLDAHRDLMPDWMGNPYSHITWARHILDIENVYLTQIFTRSWNKEEEQFISRVSESLEGIEGPVYLTVDLDVLDPIYCPEVGTPDHGVITLDELLKAVRKVSSIGLAGADIVECASQRIGSLSAGCGASVFREVLLGISEAK